MSDYVFTRQGVESNDLLSLSIVALDSKNRVSTDNADMMSAVVELAEEMDDVFLRHGVESHALLSLLPVRCWLRGMVDARDSHEPGVDR